MNNGNPLIRSETEDSIQALEVTSIHSPTEEFSPLIKSLEFKMNEQGLEKPVELDYDKYIEMEEEPIKKTGTKLLFQLNLDEKPKFIKKIKRTDTDKRSHNSIKYKPLVAGRRITSKFWKFLYYCLDHSAKAAARVIKLPLAFPPTKNINRPKLIDKSFGVFGPNNKLRRFCARVFRFKYIELFLLLVILLHWFVMATETFKYKEREHWSGIRQMIKVGIFIVYTIEAVMRMIVGGVFYDCIQPATKANTSSAPFSLTRDYQELGYRALLPPVRGAYLRSSYCRMDLLSIASFWIYMIASGPFQYENLFLFQSLSTFRTFRLLEITSGSKVILNSLKKSGPLLGNAVLFILFFMLVFSLFGTLLFRGGLRNRCVSEDGTKLQFERFCGSWNDGTPNLRSPEGAETPFKIWLTDRVTFGYTCPVGQRCVKNENPNDGLTSFDDIWHSWIYVFIVSSAQSWTPIMYNVINTTSMGSLCFFVVAVIVLNFWLLNLFIAIITDTFANIREHQGSAFVEDKDQQFIILDEDQDKPEVKNAHLRSRSFTINHLGKFRAGIINWYSKWETKLDYFFYAVIIASLGLMGSTTNYMSEETIIEYQKYEIVFTMILNIDIILKIITCTTWKQFFSSKQNTVNLVLGIVNTALIIAFIIQPFEEFKYCTCLFVIRIYRVIWAIPNVRYFLVAIFGNILPMLNMIIFIFSIILLSSVAAMQLFGGLMKEKDDDEVIFDRFDSLFWSFITLYHLFSGEDWPTILYNCMGALAEYNLSWAGVLFVFMFFGLCNFILTNLFVAVVVENLDMSEIQKRDLQLKQHIKKTDPDSHTIGKLQNLFNPYIYLPPNPKTLNLKELPQDLQLSLNTKHFHQFLKDYPIQDKDQDEKLSWVDKLVNKMDLMYKRSSRKQKSMAESRNIGGTWTKSFMMKMENNPDYLAILDNDAILDESDTKKEKWENYEAQEFHEAHPTYNSSLFIFGKRNPIRTFCQTLMNSPNHPLFPFSKWSLRWFVKNIYILFIGLAVVLSVVSTVLQTPYEIVQLKQEDQTVSITDEYYGLDIGLLCIFFIDFIVRVIADGMIFTPNAYFLNVFNCVDFFVLLLNTIDIFITKFSNGDAAEGLGRTLRACRALRVLRIINFFPNAKFTLYAILVSGFRNLFDAACLAMCFMIPWAIYLHTVFMGTFYSCNDGDDAIGVIGDCIGVFTNGKGILAPRTWTNPFFYHFDNFKTSLRILFEITSGEGWIDLMKTTMKVTGKGNQPQEWASFGNAFIIIAYNFTLSVLILSVFVSVVIDSFAQRSGTALLTGEQRKWKDFENKLRQVSPSKLPRKRPNYWLGGFCYDLASTKQGLLSRTMAFIYLSVFIILATEVDAILPKVVAINSKILLALTGLCWIETVIRIIGLGFRIVFTYWHSIIDFIILIFATVAGLLSVAENQTVALEVYYFQRYTMLIMALNIIFKIDPIHRLFATLKSSMTSILNMLLVWFIVLLVYTVAFLQIFSLTKVGKNSDEKIVNFRNFPNAMLNLFRFSQGEGWNSVMYDFTIQSPVCVSNNSYLKNDCGSPSWAYTLFMSFNVLSMYIFLNMFVSIVVDCFAYASQLEDHDTGKKIQLDRNEIRMFKSAWNKFDPSRTGYIKLTDFVKFLKCLDKPFDIQIYPNIFSVKSLVNASFPFIPGESLPEEYNKKQYTTDSGERVPRGKLQLNVLNSLINASKIDNIPKRRRIFNKIFHEAHIIADKKRGIGFTDCLLLLVRHTLVDPYESFQIPELLKYKKIQQLVEVSINSEKISGLFHTIALRKKFVKHLEEKRMEEQLKSKFPLKIDTKASALKRDASSKSVDASTPVYFKNTLGVMQRPDYNQSRYSEELDSSEGGHSMDRFFVSQNSEQPLVEEEDLIELISHSSWKNIFDSNTPKSP